MAKKKLGVASYIASLREAKGLTKTALAKKMKKTQPYLTQIEAGTRVPNVRLMKEICKALDCSKTEYAQAMELMLQDRYPEVLEIVELLRKTGKK